MNSSAATGALILIAVALAGAGVSYHFTLEARFTAIEQKLDQNAVALQQYQIAQDSATASKSDALNNLTKEVDELQSSLGPLGKATHEQTDTLTDLRKQIATLQQAEQTQEAAQKKLSDDAGQVDKIKHDIEVIPPQISPASAPIVSTPITPAPTAAASPATAPATAIHVSQADTTPNVPLPVAPHADSTAVDLRPASVINASVRALPVALPVAMSEVAR